MIERTLAAVLRISTSSTIMVLAAALTGSVLMSGEVAAGDGEEARAIVRQAGIHLAPQPLCDDRDFQVYEPSDPIQSILRIEGGCGKMFLLSDPESGELTFAAGGAYIMHPLREGEYERFALWLSERITVVGLEDHGGTQVELMSRQEDPDFSRFTVLAKPTGSEDPYHWGVYDIGLADRGEGAIVQFTFIIYAAIAEVQAWFRDDPDHLREARFLRAMRDYWFEENRALSMERP